MAMMPSATNEEEIECDQLIARMGAVRLRRGSTGNLIARMTVESNFGPWPSLRARPRSGNSPGSCSPTARI
jgi:hypothetical protein